RHIALTAREYAVLEYFLRNRGTILTREMIAEHVWGPDGRAASNIVDVYVGYLRRKIDGRGRTPLVRTVRGVGYMVGRACRPRAPVRRLCAWRRQRGCP